MTPDIPDLVARLRENCNGHPHAKIAWPHRILHEAATALEAIGRELLDEEQHNQALTKKLSSLSPHETCACSWDKPGDVCMHHSPALSTANAEVERLKSALGQYERLMLVNDVRQAAQLTAPLWLEEADRLSLAIQQAEASK